jgi:hypothetical protein
MKEAFAKWHIRPVIDAVYPFEEALAAYKHLYRGPFGKIVRAAASKSDKKTFSPSRPKAASPSSFA